MVELGKRSGTFDSVLPCFPRELPVFLCIRPWVLLEWSGDMDGLVVGLELREGNFNRILKNKKI